MSFGIALIIKQNKNPKHNLKYSKYFLDFGLVMKLIHLKSSMEYWVQTPTFNIY